VPTIRVDVEVDDAQRLWPGDSGRRRVVAVMIGKSGPSLLFGLRSMDHVFDVVWLLVSDFVR
jgi:hypothetical protein